MRFLKLFIAISQLVLTIVAQELTQSNLPIIVINTFNREIPDEPKITAHMGIINNENQLNHISDPFNEYDGYIGIETRGSSSQMFPKKSYSIETRDEIGNNLNVSLLGMPKENDWVLYAPYSDKSLLRNAVAYKLYEEMGWYSPRFRFCELILNDEYRGVYLLIEKIKRDKNRVNISKISEDDITGGYIIKIDKTVGSKIEGWYSAIQSKIYYQYHYPDPDDILDVQKSYIIDFIKLFEEKMWNIDYNNPPDENYEKVNLESFVDVAIISEFSKNVDAYRLSFYMHKDRDDKDGRLTAGPIWDYNLAFGNANYYEAGNTDGWKIEEGIPPYDGYPIPFWWEKMWQDPYFQQKFKNRWIELRKTILNEKHILCLIDSLTSLISNAAERNFQKWNILGTYIWPNYFIWKTWDEEILYLKRWIAQRINWIDNELGLSNLTYDDNSLIKDLDLIKIYPNPTNSKINILINLKLSPTKLRIKIFSINGQELYSVNDFTPDSRTTVLTLPLQNLNSGVYIVKITGKNINLKEKFILLK